MLIAEKKLETIKNHVKQFCLNISIQQLTLMFYKNEHANALCS